MCAWRKPPGRGSWAERTRAGAPRIRARPCDLGRRRVAAEHRSPEASFAPLADAGGRFTVPDPPNSKCTAGCRPGRARLVVSAPAARLSPQPSRRSSMSQTSTRWRTRARWSPGVPARLRITLATRCGRTGSRGGDVHGRVLDAVRSCGLVALGGPGAQSRPVLLAPLAAQHLRPLPSRGVGPRGDAVRPPTCLVAHRRSGGGAY